LKAILEEFPKDYPFYSRFSYASQKANSEELDAACWTLRHIFDDFLKCSSEFTY